MCKCARPSCHKPAKSSCSGCGRKQYCSSECQKKDWKKHKLMCPMLKKLSHKLQPYHEVARVRDEIFELNEGPEDDDEPSQIRVLNHLLLYTEHQFGHRVEGKTYRERADGERITNWEVEIWNFYEIIDRLTTIYLSDRDLNDTVCNDFVYPYFEKVRSILDPWVACLETDADSLNESLDKEQTSKLLDELRRNELYCEAINSNRRNYDLAEKNCERMLYYSRKREDDFRKTRLFFAPYEEKELMQERKISEIFESLRTYCNLRLQQNDRTGAKSFAEEAYDVVATAYNPVHPQVREAAAMLIRVLLTTGDFYDAERFAEVTYGNLKDPKNEVDQESEELAEGAYNLADIIRLQKGDLIKAEKIARESLRIREALRIKLSEPHLVRMHRYADHKVGISKDLLARILRDQGK